MPLARFSLIVAALVVAFCGQQLLTPFGEPRAFSQLPKAQAPLGFALLLLAGLMAAWVVWRDGDAGGGGEVANRRPALRPRLLNAGVTLVVLSVAAILHDSSSWWAIYPWGAGLALLLGAAAGGAQQDRDSQTRAPASEWLALAVVIGVAVAFRLPDVAQIPPQVHGDEAACGLEARRILHGEVDNLLGVGWYGIPYISFAISAASMRLFGDDLFGLRMASVVLGVASAPLLYGIVRPLYGASAALLAAYLLAVSHWHVHFSRIGTDYMQASFATLSALFFFVRARQAGRGIDWAVAGLAIGLACSVYYAGRVSLLIVAAVLGADWLFDRQAFRAQARGATLMVLAAVLFVAPTVAVMAWTPATLVERSGGVFVLSSANLAHSREARGDDGIGGVMAAQVVDSLTAFNWRGETSGQHSHPAPLLDFWSAAVFAVGVVAYTAVGWRHRHHLVVAWFWINLLLGSVLTVDAMFSPRMVAAVPAVFVYPALLLDRYRSLAGRAFGGAGGAVAALSLLAFLGAATVANYRDYFELHVSRLQPAGAATVLARFVEQLDDASRAYVYGRESLGYDTPRFLVPDSGAVDMGAETSRLPELAPGRPVVLIVDAAWEGADAVAESVAAAHPGTRPSTLRLADGKLAFYVYRIDLRAQ